MPYGSDRLILPYLATQGAAQGRIVRGRLSDITEMFGLSWSTSTTLQHLRRVVYCLYEPPGHMDDAAELTRRIPLVDRFCCHAENGEFTLTLSEDFHRDATTCPTFSLDVARQLSASNAALDLYAWQIWTLHHGQCHDVALLSDDGPYGVLTCAKSPGKLTQQVREWMATICQAWPECPYSLSADGKALVLELEPGTTTDEMPSGHQGVMSPTIAKTANLPNDASLQKSESTVGVLFELPWERQPT